MMKKAAEQAVHTTSEISPEDDASSLQTARRPSSIGKFKDFLNHPRRTSSQGNDSNSRSQKKEMELAQRRLEAVALYDQHLDERINDTLATEKDRSQAASEKRLWDKKTREQKEVWVTDRMMLKEGWGAGVYPEGAAGPGMWYL